MLNAKYTISIARKLGATIFVVWEDITEVKPKIMFVLIASFMLLDKQRRKLQREMSSVHRRSSDIRSICRHDSRTFKDGMVHSQEGVPCASPRE